MARWLIWSALMVAWTVALEAPVPSAEGLPGGEILITNKTIVTKTVHVAVYALLTVLGGWVPLPTRFRWLMMFGLMTHAWGTEMLQLALESICHRGGKLSDVGFDVVGIIIGVALSWRWWTRE